MLYVNQGKSCSEIGRIIGTNHTTISKYLKDNGISIIKRNYNKRKIYPIGTKFGLWTIISTDIKIDNRNKTYQLCQCCCGTTKWVNVNSLVSGRTTKCQSCRTKLFLTDEGAINIHKVMEQLFNRVVLNLKKRRKLQSMEFNITPEYLVELYEKQHHKCALTGISIELDITKPALKQKLSLDRIDSDKGYIIGNVQWVYKDVNRMKQIYNNEYFREICVKIANNI